MSVKSVAGKLVGGSVVIALVGLIIMTLMTIGINDNGYRTVIQYPNGTTTVKFTPGWYVYWFGTTTQYPDVVTFDYDDIQDDDSSLQEQGMRVRYQDGGTGTVYGKDRFSLPTDEPTMLKLHRSFRGPSGLANKLLRPVVKEAHQLTAGLLTSEGAYAEQRGTYINWARDQISGGKYATRLDERITTDIVTGKETMIKFPVIAIGEDGSPIRAADSDLGKYGIVVVSSQITSWNFEKKTLEQIAKKREATMGIITARADAERAKQDAITAEEKGKALVMQAKYEKEQEKIKAVVDAEKASDVAVIKAKQLVDVAEQQKLEQLQKKLAMFEYEKAEKARGRGDGAYKREVMEADGALAQKLDAWVKVNYRYAEAVEKQKWVPEVAMGGNGAGSTDGSAASDLINMFSVKTAKDLALDMKMNTAK